MATMESVDIVGKARSGKCQTNQHGESVYPHAPLSDRPTSDITANNEPVVKGQANVEETGCLSQYGSETEGPAGTVVAFGTGNARVFRSECRAEPIGNRPNCVKDTDAQQYLMVCCGDLLGVSQDVEDDVHGTLSTTMVSTVSIVATVDGGECDNHECMHINVCLFVRSFVCLFVCLFVCTGRERSKDRG